MAVSHARPELYLNIHLSQLEMDPFASPPSQLLKKLKTLFLSCVCRSSSHRWKITVAKPGVNSDSYHFTASVSTCCTPAAGAPRNQTSASPGAESAQRQDETVATLRQLRRKLTKLFVFIFCHEKLQARAKRAVMQCSTVD